MRKSNISICLLIILVCIIALLLTGLVCSTKTEQAVSRESSNGLAIRHLPVPNQLEPLRQIEIMCVATDLNNSPLTYEWSASGGIIKPEKDPSVIQWLAPKEEDIYAITVIVSNSEGTKVTKTVSINVTEKEAQHPKIYAVACDNCKNHTDASRFSDYIVRCEAVDPNHDEMRYIWFASIGKMEGYGDYATWSTGAQFGNALITVIVIDSQGNESTGYLTINVACCN